MIQIKPRAMHPARLPSPKCPRVVNQPALRPPATRLARIARSAGLPRRVLAMAAFALLLIVLLATAVFSTAQRYRSDQRWMLHSYQVASRPCN